MDPRNILLSMEIRTDMPYDEIESIFPGKEWYVGPYKVELLQLQINVIKETKKKGGKKK